MSNTSDLIKRFHLPGISCFKSQICECVVFAGLRGALANPWQLRFKWKKKKRNIRDWLLSPEARSQLLTWLGLERMQVREASFQEPKDAKRPLIWRHKELCWILRKQNLEGRAKEHWHFWNLGGNSGKGQKETEVRPKAHKKLAAPSSHHMSTSYLQGGPLAKGLEHRRAYCNPSPPLIISSKA